MNLLLQGFLQKGWMGCVAQNGAQGMVIFDSGNTVALSIFYFNISSISCSPPTVVCYGCWLFPKSHPSLFDVICSYLFFYTKMHFSEESAHLMVERFQRRCYKDAGLYSEGSSSSSEVEESEESLSCDVEEDDFLSDVDEPSDRDLSSVCDCDDCLAL